MVLTKVELFFSRERDIFIPRKPNKLEMGEWREDVNRKPHSRPSLRRSWLPGLVREVCFRTADAV